MKTGSLIQTFLDGSRRESVSKKICDFLDETFPNTRNTGSVDFTGIIWGSELPPAVFFPKGAQIPDDGDQRQELIRLLISCLRRYDSLNSKSYAAESNNDILSCPELELLERYQREGLYSNRAKYVSKTIKGTIDWKRTINAGKASINSDGSLFYLDTMKRGYRSKDTQIRKIQASLVYEAASEFRWLMEVRLCDEVMASRAKPVPAETAIQIIRTELSQQFSEEKIRLLQLLLAVLERKLAGSTLNGSVLGTTRFEHVWEHMISTYLADQKHEFKNLATPAYVYDSGDIERHTANSPRPDTILHGEERIAVIDAKYYDFAVSKPQWGDLVKQFFYAKTFEMQFGKDNVSNWFIMPGVDNDGVHEAIVIGADKTPLSEQFTPIRIRFKDPFEVMRYYASYESSSRDRAALLAG